MTIAKRITNCKEERNVVLQGIYELIQNLDDAKKRQEASLKTSISHIISNTHLLEDEKYTQKQPLITQLQELEECNIRIIRFLFLGLYSFWEISLMDMVNTYIQAKENNRESNNKGSKKRDTSYYINLMYTKPPPLIGIIDSNIREFRNYMVHGTLDERRTKIINNLMYLYPNFCISKTCNGYYISDYGGLVSFIEIYSHELDSAENKLIRNDNIN